MGRIEFIDGHYEVKISKYVTFCFPKYDMASLNLYKGWLYIVGNNTSTSKALSQTMTVTLEEIVKKEFPKGALIDDIGRAKIDKGIVYASKAHPLNGDSYVPDEYNAQTIRGYISDVRSFLDKKVQKGLKEAIKNGPSGYYYDYDYAFSLEAEQVHADGSEIITDDSSQEKRVYSFSNNEPIMRCYIPGSSKVQDKTQKIIVEYFGNVAAVALGAGKIVTRGFSAEKRVDEICKNSIYQITLSDIKFASGCTQGFVIVSGSSATSSNGDLCPLLVSPTIYK